MGVRMQKDQMQIRVSGEEGDKRSAHKIEQEVTDREPSRRTQQVK